MNKQDLQWYLSGFHHMLHGTSCWFKSSFDLECILYFLVNMACSTVDIELNFKIILLLYSSAVLCILCTIFRLLTMTSL